MISISEGHWRSARVLRSLILLMIERTLINMNDILRARRYNLIGFVVAAFFSIAWGLLRLGGIFGESCALAVLAVEGGGWVGLKK